MKAKQNFIGPGPRAPCLPYQGKEATIQNKCSSTIINRVCSLQIGGLQ